LIHFYKRLARCKTKMREVKVSSPGKVILYGEHAVVFGKTALAVSIDLRTRLHIQEGTDILVLKFPDLNKIYTWRLGELSQLRTSLCIHPSDLPTPADAETIAGVNNFVKSSCNNNSGTDQGVVAFLYLYLKMFSALPPLAASLDSDIPIGAGLGSSAAMSVCFSSSLYLYSQQLISSKNGLDAQTNGQSSNRTLSLVDLGPEDKTLVSDWAFMSEKIMHGTPSGIDNSVSTFGGVLAYRSGEMKAVSGLSDLQVLLVNTKVPRNTRDLVTAVKNKHNLLPKVIGPVFEAIEIISQTAISTLQSSASKGFKGCSKEFRTLEDLIDINQGLLAGLGVSHPALGRVVEVSALNGIHAKLTGAGGGGFALGLITPHVHRHQVEKTRQELEEIGFGVYETEIGGEGVKAWTN